MEGILSLAQKFIDYFSRALLRWFEWNRPKKMYGNMLKIEK